MEPQSLATAALVYRASMSLHGKRRSYKFYQLCRPVYAFNEAANGSGSVGSHHEGSPQNAEASPILDLASIKQLLVSGADPNAFSPPGYTPLFLAAHGEQEPFPPAQIQKLIWRTTVLVTAWSWSIQMHACRD